MNSASGRLDSRANENGPRGGNGWASRIAVGRMGVWMVVGVLTSIVGLAFRWRRRSPSGNLDGGAVSESWLREHRADRQDPFSS